MRYAQAMEKKQQTLKGADIPIPKRSDFLRNLKKAAAPGPKKSRPSRPPK